jgi:hypothetical protein
MLSAGAMNCDFCHSLGPRWCYPATNFVMVSTRSSDHGSDGGWAACDECSNLIDGADCVGEWFKPVYARLCRNAGNAVPPPVALAIWTAFDRNRVGSRLPLAEEVLS